MKKRERGFTLIELLVVIAILGVLGGIAVPRVVGAIESARRGANVANAAILQSAVVRFNIDNVGDWPTNDVTSRPALIHAADLVNYLTGGRLPRLNLGNMGDAGTPGNFVITTAHSWGLNSDNLVVVVLTASPHTVVWTPAP